MTVKFSPWHYSRFDLEPNVLDKLQLPTGVDLSKVPQHPELGMDVAQLTKGRQVGQTARPDPFFYLRENVTKNIDTTGDGLPDTFVTMSAFDPDAIYCVSVGAPADSDLPHTVYYGAKANEIRVKHENGDEETFGKGSYQRLTADRDRRIETWRDFNGDGSTDYIQVGLGPSSNAKGGWPYLGYGPVEEE